MQPCAFDRIVPKGAAARLGSAGGLSSPSSGNRNAFGNNSSPHHRSDSDNEGTDSDEDVLKMNDQTINNQRRRRSSTAVKVSTAGSFALPGQQKKGETRSTTANDDGTASSSTFQQDPCQQQYSSSFDNTRSLSDKFFDPKLVRIRAENQRKKSQKSLDNSSAAASLSEEAQALGASASKSAEKSAKLNSGEMQCSVQFAPVISCIDENPADILRPQAPPAAEHSTMVSFESENMLVLFGGLCNTANDAYARANVSESYSSKKKNKKNKSAGDGNNSPFSSGDDDDDDNPQVSEMPTCGVVSNTTWIYDTKNLIWFCVTETDLMQASSSVTGGRQANGISKSTAAKINRSVFGNHQNSNKADDENDHDDPANLQLICPAPRCGHTAVAMFDDPLPKKTHLPSQSKVSKRSGGGGSGAKHEYLREPMMVVYGGCDLRKQVSYGDVWAFFIRVKKWKCLFDCASVPRGNLTFSLDLIPSDPNDFQTKDKMSFFPDDADFFEGEDVKARLLALTGKVTGHKLHAAATARRPIRRAPAPCQRWKAVAGSLDELMFIFGGESASFDVLDDLHTFNVMTQQWEVMTTRMTPWPSGRFQHSACVVGTKMVISGGTGKRSDVVLEDDTWILEMRTMMWRQVMGTNEVLASARTAADALERCPFLTRPRHVQQLPAMINPTAKRLDLKAGITSNLDAASGVNRLAWVNGDVNSARNAAQVARCEVEGPTLLPFDDRIIFYGGREVPTGRFVNSTFVLDLISERWFKAEDVLMDQSNLHLHGDISMLSPLPIAEKTDSMLPAKRWAHCACAVIKYSPTRSMTLARSLSEIAQECGGNNICGTVRFTDQKAIDKYILELQKDVLDQADFDGILGTRNNKPTMQHTLRAFFFGGGATCSGSGANSRIAELSDCWQMNLQLK